MNARFRILNSFMLPLALSVLLPLAAWAGNDCQAAFSWEEYNGPLPQVGGIVFSNESAGDFEFQSWNFGDGNVSSTMEPQQTHFFTNSGSYEVCLTVWNSDQSCNSKTCLSVSISLSGNPCSQNECVLPGDVNLDGQANHLDLITLAQGYGAEGPVRPNASIAWVPQEAPDWNQTTAEGINFKHLDCDGNGLINTADVLAITTNYNPNLIEDNGGETNDPSVYIEFEKDTIFVPADATEPIEFYANVYIGTEDRPIDALNGLALSLHYDTTHVLEANGIGIDYEEASFFGPTPEVLPFELNLRPNRQFDMAFTRTDQRQVGGYGAVAQMRFIVEADIIDGRASGVDSEVFDLPIKSASAVDSLGNELPLSLRNQAAYIVFVKQVRTSTSDPKLAEAARIYPNPTTEWLHIDAIANTKLQAVQIFDATGRMVLSNQQALPQLRISTAGFEKGIYLVMLHTSKGIFTERVLVRP